MLAIANRLLPQGKLQSREKQEAMESRALNIFGSKVRELRKARHLSQEALAEAAGVNRSYLSEIEQGIVSPTIIVVLRLAKAFDVPASDLVADFDAATLARMKL